MWPVWINSTQTYDPRGLGAWVLRLSRWSNMLVQVSGELEKSEAAPRLSSENRFPWLH
jgi:hypothetical protein